MIVKKIKSMSAQRMFEMKPGKPKAKELIFYSIRDCSEIDLFELKKELKIYSTIAFQVDPYERYDIVVAAERGAEALAKFSSQSSGDDYREGDIIVAALLCDDGELYGVSAYDEGIALFNCEIDKEEYSCLPSNKLVRVVAGDLFYRLRKTTEGRVDFSELPTQALLENYRQVDASLLTIYRKKDLETEFDFYMTENNYIEVVALKPDELTPDKLTDLCDKLRVFQSVGTRSAGARTEETGRTRYEEYFKLGKEIAEQYAYPIVLVANFFGAAHIVTMPDSDRVAIFNAKAMKPRKSKEKAVAFAQEFGTVMGIERSSSLEKRFNILNASGCRDLGIMNIGSDFIASPDSCSLVELNAFAGKLDFANILRSAGIRDIYYPFDGPAKNARLCDKVCKIAQELYADRICICSVRHIMGIESDRFILGSFDNGQNFPILFNAELITKYEDLILAKNSDELVVELKISDDICGNIKLSPGKVVSIGDILKNPRME